MTFGGKETSGIIHDAESGKFAIKEMRGGVVTGVSIDGRRGDAPLVPAVLRLQRLVSVGTTLHDSSFGQVAD